MNQTIREAPKPTKRLRRLRASLATDSELSQLVASLRLIVKKSRPRPHKLRAAVDLVVQEMRERKYRKELHGTTQCGGGSSEELSS